MSKKDSVISELVLKCHKAGIIGDIKDSKLQEPCEEQYSIDDIKDKLDEYQSTNKQLVTIMRKFTKINGEIATIQYKKFMIERDNIAMITNISALIAAYKAMNYGSDKETENFDKEYKLIDKYLFSGKR